MHCDTNGRYIETDWLEHHRRMRHTGIVPLLCNVRDMTNKARRRRDALSKRPVCPSRRRSPREAMN